MFSVEKVKVVVGGGVSFTERVQEYVSIVRDERSF